MHRHRPNDVATKPTITRVSAKFYRPGACDRVLGANMWRRQNYRVFQNSVKIQLNPSFYSGMRRRWNFFVQQRKSFGIIPGGFQEAALMKLGTDRVWINERKGFVKVTTDCVRGAMRQEGQRGIST